MKLIHKQTAGWIQAAVAVFIFMGISNVFGRYGAHIYKIQPVIFSCAAFASCALSLLFFAGKGPLGKETMRSLDTWAYGMVLMLNYILGIHLFMYVSSTEGTMLQKLSVFFGVIGSWFFLMRKPDTYQFLGTLLTVLGVIIVCLGIQENQGIVLTLAILFAMLQSLRMFIAELHRPHAVAMKTQKSIKDRARVVGFVMFTMSCIFTTFALFIASMQSLSDTPFVSGLPLLTDFWHTPSLIMGLIAGIFIIAPLRMLEFSSTNLIKAENFATVAAFSVIATLFWEWATSPLTGLSIKTVSSLDILAGGLITLGALTIALTRPLIHKKKQANVHIQASPQNPQAVEDSRDILAETLEHFSGNIKKSSDALGLPQYAVKTLMGDNMRKLAFVNLGDVQRMFRQNVAGQDALTGLLNRNAFKRLSTELLGTSKSCTLLYIDLDKFKPINDTYGHDAGDAILIEAANRMKKQLPEGSLVCRMGGDEFCALLPLKATKAKHITPLLKAIQAPITVQGVSDELTIGASIGIAHYPKDGETLEELISHADEGMYGVKHSRES
ncbi:MAG: diguanylate cyclase [Pseudomonadota bacterium]|nr:diguanylate cyclase [Pseudomonadota bacterium]